MKKSDILTAKVLTYLGILPFAVLNLAIYAKMPEYDYGFIMRSYGAVIIAFLCGIHWAFYLSHSEKCPHNLLLHSNFVTLIAWLTLLTHFGYINFIIQFLCFTYLFLLDYEMFKAQIIPIWFYELRRNATFVVCLLVLTAVLNS